MGFFGRSKKAKKESPSSSPSVQQLEWTAPQIQEYQPPQITPSAQVSQSWYPNEPYQPPHEPPRLLRSPPGWNEAMQNPTPIYQQGPYPSIVVNQHHYYLSPPPPPQSSQRPSTSSGLPSKLGLGSVLDLAGGMRSGTRRSSDDGLASWNGHKSSHKSQWINQGAALCDQISERFNDVMTLIDGDRFTGNEKDLYSWQPGQSSSSNMVDEKGPHRTGRRDHHRRDQPKGQTTAVAASVMSGTYFSKVELYANSRLPMDLPPLKLYVQSQ